ncbi:hypothetical protein PMAYCL1PPCAC_02894 [Pristionchus mayeri]|uniref:VWFA domain-containing protein n=1 Tax=Pristionchus mayeri TaxID=1317129 RepID=A0AAN4Z406_9BILA|nr:hypothetical protein PMAYCL1PPCAC_02894 [Pristionchus mayeri]
MLVGAGSATAIRRVTLHTGRFTSTSSDNFLKIGNVAKAVKAPRRPELVPTGYAKDVSKFDSNPELVAHLKWLLQKDLLNQDVFLIGPPGRLRSQIVLQYLELTQSEFEWLSITRDSTEGDIKQRREIRGGNAFYSDLGAVRAAIDGRVLVIDGVEKAERNVLPILNNLLENREMQLDDGRFLMHHNKFNRLEEKYSLKELRSMGLERVSPLFRVIALGLPVPKFPGYPLDPPLRSRFQSRHVPDLSFETSLLLCRSVAPRVSSSRLSNLISLVFALNAQETLSFPYVPVSNLEKVAQIWNTVPDMPTEWAFNLLYPREALLSEGETKRIKDFLTKFDIEGKKPNVHAKVSEDAKIPRGTDSVSPSPSFVATSAHEEVITGLTASLSVGDIALLGSKGAGKSTVVKEMAARLGFRPTTLVVYQDMNSRELLQSRRMNESGDTLWEDSPLVKTAREGGLCVLDGIDRVHPSALSALAPLLHHRRIDLPDGSRLVGSEEFAGIAAKTGLSVEELRKRGITEIKEAFRLVLVGDTLSCLKGTRWMNSPIAALTPFMQMERLEMGEKVALIRSVVPQSNPETVKTIVKFAEELTLSHDPALNAVASSLSLRRLIQIAKRETLEGGSIRSLLERATLSRFFPSLTKKAFDGLMETMKIKDVEGKNEYDLHSEMEAVGGVGVKEGVEEEAMIPETLFYHNDHHTSVLVDMARDFRLGEHLLLIGNQGVGKNKITDRFLQLINRSRQYMQLHRDTTVESLTLETKVEGGVVKCVDSALVRAVRNGHILVVDEADKASVHVIAVLKSLLDEGTLQLGDGRRIVPSSWIDPSKGDSSNLIPLHPQFRAILLANRPGFPFLGNDLFGTIGDLCAVHVIDNPSRDSEMEMLKQYAPKVDRETLLKLIGAFDDLRKMADEGSLQYPYSTREIVAVAKHLNEFPDDAITEVVRNVFDFDQYSTDRLETVEEVFQKHGIPLGVNRVAVRVAEVVKIPSAVEIGRWKRREGREMIAPSVIDIEREWLSVPHSLHSFTESSTRSEMFTEQLHKIELPFGPNQLGTDLTVLGPNSIIAVAVNPSQMYWMHGDKEKVVVKFDLFSHGSFGGRQNIEPVIRVIRLNEEQALIHEESTGETLHFDTRGWSFSRLTSKSRGFMDTLSKITQPMFGNKENRAFIPGDRVASYQKGGTRFDLLDSKLHCISLTLPDPIDKVVKVDGERFIVQSGTSTSLLKEERHGWSLTPIEINLDGGVHLKTALKNGEGTGLFFDATNCYYAKSEDTEESPILASLRPSTLSPLSMVDRGRPHYLSDKALSLIDPTRNVLRMDGDIVVRVRPRFATPKEAVHKEGSPMNVDGFLEAIDTKSGEMTYIPVPPPRRVSYAGNRIARFTPTNFVMTKDVEGDKVLTLDTGGVIRSFEVSRDALSKSFTRWKDMVEGKGREKDRVEYTMKTPNRDMLKTPTVGKFDPSNAPHHGGGVWAGGSGGYNTAGLGGAGGPFRLDSGNDVHQIPEFAKRELPDHIIKKAKELGKEEYAKRLKEIKMSEHDAESYKSLWDRIEGNVKHVREIIDGFEAKKKERVWLRHQTTGDLDDSKLIEGIAGENNIYRRRQDKDPDPGTPQTKPKRLRVCMDLSGSMYRFNGYDKRLQRSMETALLVMTALEGKEEKVKYELTGHSGDGPCTPFVTRDRYPQNDKERLNILKEMLAHTQFCSSGDYTLEALNDARKTLAKDEESDDRIVLLLSDANLERYGIQPKSLARLMDKDDGVKAYVILIGSLGEQAEELQSALPPGRSFVVKDTAQLPKIIQEIFDANIL